MYVFTPSKELGKMYKKILVEPDKETLALIDKLAKMEGMAKVNDEEKFQQEYLAENITSLVRNHACKMANVNEGRETTFVFTENGRLKSDMRDQIICRLEIDTKFVIDDFFTQLTEELIECLRINEFKARWGKAFVKDNEIFIKVREDGFKFKMPDLF